MRRCMRVCVRIAGSCGHYSSGLLHRARLRSSLLPACQTCNSTHRHLPRPLSHPASRHPPPPPCPPPAGTAELKAHLGSRRAAPFWARIADFHLLLYLARQPNLDLPEVGLLADAVRGKGEVPEGFQLIVQSMAGLM